MIMWIEVKKQLPEPQIEILLWSDIVEIGIFFEDGTFFDDLGIAEVDRVTHWMPLPKPPRKR